MTILAFQSTLFLALSVANLQPAAAPSLVTRHPTSLPTDAPDVADQDRRHRLDTPQHRQQPLASKLKRGWRDNGTAFVGWSARGRILTTVVTRVAAEQQNGQPDLQRAQAEGEDGHPPTRPAAMSDSDDNMPLAQRSLANAVATAPPKRAAAPIKSLAEVDSDDEEGDTPLAVKGRGLRTRRKALYVFGMLCCFGGRIMSAST